MRGFLTAILFVFLAEPGFAAPVVHVPLVGCPADGQTGPQPAPKGHSVAVHLAPRFAARVAFYKSDYGRGVLAPRGWHCLGLYGSNGSFVLVTPKPYGFKDHWARRSINGPGIEYGVSIGGTSGRFAVAGAIRRYFPDQEAFFDRLIQGDEPKSDFPVGRYPKDRVLYRTKTTIVLDTPSAAEGEGSHSWLGTGDEPVRSVIALTDVGEIDGPNVVELSIRLAPKDRNLLAPIVREAFPAIPGLN